MNVVSIVVTFNGLPWIDRCLKSLLKSSFPTTIIVVDNASSDGTPAYIQSHYPDIQLIRSAKNLGFGQGNNLGLAVAAHQAADFVFLLNQDAWVDPNAIDELVRYAERNDQYGILSPIHFNGTGTGLDVNFSTYLTRSDLRSFLLNSISGEILPEIVDTHFVNAAAWLISGDCLKKTGGFDPIFFHYGEDDNYAQRARFKGFRIGIHTGTFIFHDRAQQTPGQKNMDPNKQIKQDCLHFMIHTCNPFVNNWRGAYLKRLVRHILFGSLNVVAFQKTKSVYNFKMAGVLLRSRKAIQRSRLSSMDTREYLHLTIHQPSHSPALVEVRKS